MTLMNWISIGITAALVAAYIVLKIYAKRKTRTIRRAGWDYYPAQGSGKSLRT